MVDQTEDAAGPLSVSALARVEEGAANVANHKVLRAFSYFPKGVERTQENVDQRKDAAVGDVVNDLYDDDAAGLEAEGIVESTQARAVSTEEKGT